MGRVIPVQELARAGRIRLAREIFETHAAFWRLDREAREKSEDARRAALEIGKLIFEESERLYSKAISRQPRDPYYPWPHNACILIELLAEDMPRIFGDETRRVTMLHLVQFYLECLKSGQLAEDGDEQQSRSAQR